MISKHSWVGIGVIVGFFLLSGCSSASTKAVITQADRAFQTKNYDQALALLQPELEKNPRDQTLLMKKADIIRAQQDRTGFLDIRPKLTTKTIQTNPELPRRELIAMIKTNRWNEATKRVNTLLQADPANADRLQLKGQMFYLQNDLPWAIQLYDEALASNPTHVETLVNKAIARADQGKLLESLWLFDQALQLSPDDYLIRYNKWTVLSDLGFQQKSLLATGSFSYFSQALRHFEKAYTLNPAYIDTLVWLGITYLDMGEISKAHAALDIVLNQNETITDAWYYQGKAFLAEKNIEQAKITFEHLLTIDPTYTLAEQELIDIQEKYGTGSRE